MYPWCVACVRNVCSTTRSDRASAERPRLVSVAGVLGGMVGFGLDTQIHPNAVAAAEVAMCAARQGKFWETHDALFLRQPVWAPMAEPGPYLIALAESTGVDRGALVPCVTTKATRAEVEADAQRAARSGARSTPTFYIEGGLLVGAAPADVYRQVLDSIYRAKAGAP